MHKQYYRKLQTNSLAKAGGFKLKSFQTNEARSDKIKINYIVKHRKKCGVFVFFCVFFTLLKMPNIYIYMLSYIVYAIDKRYIIG